MRVAGHVNLCLFNELKGKKASLFAFDFLCL